MPKGTKLKHSDHISLRVPFTPILHIEPVFQILWQSVIKLNWKTSSNILCYKLLPTNRLPDEPAILRLMYIIFNFTCGEYNN